MKLYDLLKENPDEEITVWDENYDLETYFYGGFIELDDKENDEWNTAMYKLAKKLELIRAEIKYGRICATVNLSQIIKNNLDKLKEANLFVYCDVDIIMHKMPNILAGSVSAKWLENFVNALSRTDERFSEQDTFSEEEQTGVSKELDTSISEQDSAEETEDNLEPEM